MKILGLDGKEYSWNITKYKGHVECSSLHLRARFVLKQEFPLEIIYEELTLPGTKVERQNKPLFADFFIPLRRIMIEVQGEQHYKFNQFFHNNKMEFFKSKFRDKNKKLWCNFNNIIMIEFPYDENDIQWIERLRNRS